MADVVLVPGLWLDASSWDLVATDLERAGHRATALTLPGMESPHADRSRVTLADHVSAVVQAIDSAAGPVVLVAHSAGCGIAHAALDARTERVARAVHVGGFPTGDGDTIADDFPVVDGEVPLPDFSVFGDDELAGLDEAARAEFRARAIPVPGRVITDRQRLFDERRYDVPVTIVATEFTASALQEWVSAGLAPVAELAGIRDVTYVDLPTGHWPQFSRPADLAGAILAQPPLQT